ncbi:MAG TPA: zf-HC2 domain-containing protein [Vicinamibacterales bacterium]|nr:zf-HC2 domain-containing protein [Vicinamibacterales bacterium]
MNNHLTDDELILHSYGEIDRADRARVDAHLAECAQCQVAKENLARVMTMIDTAPPVEAPAGFERIAWARVQQALDSDGGLVRRSATRGGGIRSFFWFPQWALAGGVAALLVAAFWAGRISGGDPATPSPAAGIVADIEPERVLQATVGDHLDRSEMMLVELANAETDGADVLAGEQERAVDLVAANRLIRQSALQSGDAQIVDILEDLERVLLEIANAPATVTSNDLTDLQSRITREDLLFRLRVIASEMRQQQRTDRATDGPNLRRTPRS